MRNHRIFFRNTIGFILIVSILNSCSSPSEKAIPSEPAPVEKPEPSMFTVEISQMKFWPTVVTVKVGDTIKFLNRDVMSHDITEESQKAWSSGPLTTNQSWTLIAAENVNYFCSIHPVMKGKIIVEQ